MGGDEPEAWKRSAEWQKVFPAWAGMNRGEGGRNQRGDRVPRVGGDEPMGTRKQPRRERVFPAWAGMNRWG